MRADPPSQQIRLIMKVKPLDHKTLRSLATSYRWVRQNHCDWRYGHLASAPEIAAAFPGIEIDAEVYRGLEAGVNLASNQSVRDPRKVMIAWARHEWSD